MNALAINDITINPFDTSSKDVCYLLSYGERNFEVSESVAKLVEVLKTSRTIGEAAERFSEQRGANYTVNDIEGLYTQYIYPIFEETTHLKKNVFLWSKELIPNSIVAFAPKYLKFLFRFKTMIVLIALIFVAEVLFLYVGSPSITMRHVDILVMAGVLILFICSSIVHEFGHATASSYCGVKPRGIGIALYINFPVFYTDVSDVWKLSRKQRTLVNLGGVYFQCLFLLPLFVIYFITWSDVLKYFIITVNLNFILTLNPFFKFDGYWIMSDLLGVPNLRSRSKELFCYYWDKLRGRQPNKEPYMLSLKRSARVIFISYSVIVNLFFLYYFCYIMPKFLLYFIENFPRMAKQLVEMIAMGQLPTMQFIMSVFGQLVMVSLIVYMLYGMIKPLAKKMSVKKSA